MPDDLFHLARRAMAKCHAPYSNFPVGAAIRTEDGRLFSGCNVEVVSFPEGWCAETTAIGQKVMDGGGRIAEVAVVASRLRACSPCGGCRQRIAEFGSPATMIHLCDATEGVVESVPLGTLLPHAFPKDAVS